MRPATPPQLALLERLSSGPVRRETLVGREALSLKALLRNRWAISAPVADPSAKSGVGFILAITPAGRLELAMAEERSQGRSRTERAGFRLPVSVQPYLERGAAIHGTKTAAVVAALVKSYPPA